MYTYITFNRRMVLRRKMHICKVTYHLKVEIFDKSLGENCKTVALLAAHVHVLCICVVQKHTGCYKRVYNIIEQISSF